MSSLATSRILHHKKCPRRRAFFKGPPRFDRITPVIRASFHATHHDTVASFVWSKRLRRFSEWCFSHSFFCGRLFSSSIYCQLFAPIANRTLAKACLISLRGWAMLRRWSTQFFTPYSTKYFDKRSKTSSCVATKAKLFGDPCRRLIGSSSRNVLKIQPKIIVTPPSKKPTSTATAATTTTTALWHREHTKNRNKFFFHFISPFFIKRFVVLEMETFWSCGAAREGQNEPKSTSEILQIIF